MNSVSSDHFGSILVRTPLVIIATLIALFLYASIIEPDGSEVIGLMGFDGFAFAQFDASENNKQLYEAARRIIMPVIIVLLVAMSILTAYATWHVAAGRRTTRLMRRTVDSIHSFIASMVVMGWIAAMMHGLDIWNTMLYHGSDQGVLSYFGIFVRKANPLSVLLLIGLQAVIWYCVRLILAPRWLLHSVNALIWPTWIIAFCAAPLCVIQFRHFFEGLRTARMLGLLTLIWSITTLGLQLAMAAMSHQKFADDHCQKCGYNLKGATGTTCPECGAAMGLNTDG